MYNNSTTISSELDFYFPQLKLAIEINGIVHYEPIYGSNKFDKINLLIWYINITYKIVENKKIEEKICGYDGIKNNLNYMITQNKGKLKE